MIRLIKYVIMIGLSISTLLSFGACQSSVEVQLGILLDGSGSIQPDDWNITKGVLANSVRDIIPKDGTVELTIVQFGGFGGSSKIEIPPTVITASNSSIVENQIRAISKIEGNTPLGEGLRLIADTIFGSPEFDPSIKQYVNIATDGLPNIPLKSEQIKSDILINVELGELKTDPKILSYARDYAVEQRNYLISKLQLTDNEDRINSEALGYYMTPNTIAWIKEHIIWPQPGNIAPPYPNDVGWVREVREYSEFEDAIRKKFEVGVLDLDFGDAPDNPYPTYINNNGARHIVIDGIYLGVGIDSESDGQPNPGADGDDNDGNDDEDGIIFTTGVIKGSSVIIEVAASTQGKLNAWVDFNQDGDWADSNEHVLKDVDLVAGHNSLNFDVPSNAIVGDTYGRFRFNKGGGLSFDGFAEDGEVEDYQIIIKDPGTKPPKPEPIQNISLDNISSGEQYAFAFWDGYAFNDLTVEKDQQAGCICLDSNRLLSNSKVENFDWIHSGDQLAIADGNAIATNYINIRSTQSAAHGCEC